MRINTRARARARLRELRALLYAARGLTREQEECIMPILIKLELYSVGCRRHPPSAPAISSSPVILHFTMRRLIRTPYTAGSIRPRAAPCNHRRCFRRTRTSGRGGGGEVLRERAISATRLLSAQCRCNEMITGVVDAFGIPLDRRTPSSPSPYRGPAERSLPRSCLPRCTPRRLQPVVPSSVDLDDSRDTPHPGK